jgi:hypothetical protein
LRRIATPSMLVLSLTLAACGGGGGGAEPSHTASETQNTSASSPAGLGTSTSPEALAGGTPTTSPAPSAANPAPSAPAPSAPAPSATAPSATAPSAPAPSATAPSAIAPSASTPTAPAPTAPANTGVTTIDQVIADMNSTSEAMVIDPRYSWQSKPAITMYSPAGKYIPSWWTGNRPEWSYNVLTWFVAYEAQGNAATNTRVQIKNLRFYVLSQSTRTWRQFDAKATPGIDLWQYPFRPAGSSAGTKYESSGGISMKPKYPYFHHGYGNSVRITPQDVRAIYVDMDFRLTVDDASKPDDRSKAKYVVDTGGDYWPGNGQGDWSLGYAPGMGNSRMLLATKDWRKSTLLIPNFAVGASYEELRKNPPPLN